MKFNDNVKVFITTDIYKLTNFLSKNIKKTDENRDFTLDEHVVIVPDYSLTRWLKFKFARNQVIYHNIKFITMEPFLLSCIPPENIKNIWNQHDLLTHIFYFFVNNSNILTSIIHKNPDEKDILSVSSELALIINRNIRQFPDLNLNIPADEPFYKPLQLVFNYLTSLKKEKTKFLSVNDYLNSGGDIFLPESLHIFTPGFIEKYFYTTIDNISKKSNVYLYSNTIQIFESPENQILSSFGKAYTLNSSNVINYSDNDNNNNVVTSFETFSPVDTLGLLKNILNNDNVFKIPENPYKGLSLLENLPLTDLEQTVNFISAPGLIRECETVKDIILEIISTDNEAKLSDICINIADSSQKNRYYTVLSFFLINSGISVTAVDTKRESISGILDFTEKLLKLTTSDFSFQTLKEVIFHDSFFSLDSTRKELLTDIFSKAGIHRGVNLQDLSDTYISNDLVNWKQGLFRIICSCFLDPEDPGIFETKKGRYVGIKGLTEEETVFSFTAKVLKLLEKIEEIKKTEKQPLNYWTEVFVKLLNDFAFTPDISDSTLLRDINFSITRIGQHSCDDLLISYYIIIEIILSELALFREKAGQYSGRGVTLSSFESLRTIPFKYRFVMGLNEKGFPPTETISVLDPIKNSSFSNTSKAYGYFIEAVFSTDKCLWLTYRNRHLKTSSPLNPSKIFSDLHTYLELQTGAKIEIYNVPPVRTDNQYINFHGKYNKEAYQEIRALIEPESEKINSFQYVYSGRKSFNLKVKLIENFLVRPWESWIEIYGGMPQSKPEKEIDFFEPITGSGLQHNVLIDDLFAAMVTETGSIEDIVLNHTKDIDLAGNLPTGIFLDIYRKSLVSILEGYNSAFSSCFNTELTKKIIFPCLKKMRNFKKYYEIKDAIQIKDYEISGYLGPIFDEKNTIIKLKKGNSDPHDGDIANVLVRALLMEKITNKSGWQAVFLHPNGNHKKYKINVPSPGDVFLENIVNALTGPVSDDFIKIIGLSGVKGEKMKSKLKKSYEYPSRDNFDLCIYNHFILELPENPEELFREITGFEDLEEILENNEK